MKLQDLNVLEARRRSGPEFFKVGQLYMLNSDYRAGNRSGATEVQRKHHTPLPKGGIVLCTKNEPVIHPVNNAVMPYSIIEFLFGETVIHYVSDAWQLCEVMDPLTPNEGEEERANLCG